MKIVVAHLVFTEVLEVHPDTELSRFRSQILTANHLSHEQLRQYQQFDDLQKSDPQPKPA